MLKPGGFRADVALYTLSRAVDVIVHHVTGRPPGKHHFHYLWGAFAFCLMQAVLMHAFITEPHTLRPSYCAWIARMTGNTTKEYLPALQDAVMRNEGYEIPTTSPQGRGFIGLVRDTSIGALEVLLGSRPYTDSRNTVSQPITGIATGDQTVAKVPEPKIKVDCSRFHANCNLAGFDAFRAAFQEALKMYLPLVAIPPLARVLLSSKARSNLTFSKAVQNLVLTPLKSAIRSATFFGAYTGGGFAVMCFLRRCVKHEHRFVFMLTGLLAGLPILIEKHSRYPELNIYCIARTAETIYNSVAEHFGRTNVKFVDTPLLDVCVFSWSCAVLFWALQHKPQFVRASFRGALSKTLGVN
eukprot:c10795_g1_i2.p1 GENE.c10795_g1_i2~~c10795_g1_i2.p1  ORF type:complete len:355 (+),score=78.92 c10795_g1_i2:564-1628(+)